MRAFDVEIKDPAVNDDPITYSCRNCDATGVQLDHLCGWHNDREGIEVHGLPDLLRALNGADRPERKPAHLFNH